jgi:hypothetical protein
MTLRERLLNNVAYSALVLNRRFPVSQYEINFSAPRVAPAAVPAGRDTPTVTVLR